MPYLFFPLPLNLPPSTSYHIIWLLSLSLSRQALFVFMALSFARDEIIWLLRHADNIQKKSTDDFIDKYGPSMHTHTHVCTTDACSHLYKCNQCILGMFSGLSFVCVFVCVCVCVLQAHRRADLLHGGAQSSCQEVWSGDAAILCPVPVWF